MKKLGLLFLFVISLIGTSQLKASHLWGGEITWECLSNGKFIFKMNIYRDCSGIPSQYVNQLISITGSPLPNSGGTSLITLKPDTNKWMQQNNGAINVNCDTGQVVFSCQNNDQGALQVFYYKSDPVNLNGTPPASGWTFFWSDNSRPAVLNGASGPLGLRATMYPILNPNGSPQYLSTNTCNDNSPQFSELPEPLFCRGTNINYSNQVTDKEFDSLVYSLARPLGGTVNSVLNFTSPYDFNQPLPSASINPNNIPLQLDAFSGWMNFAVHNGSGHAPYLTVLQIDAYRGGQKIASVYRDVPFRFIDCSPISSGTVNNAPTISFSGTQSNNYQVTVMAGNLLQLPVQIVDGDIDSSRTPSVQRVTASFNSQIFSANFNDPNNCANIQLSSCATLSPPPVQSAGSPYQLTNLAGVSTLFNWQTDSSHLGENYSSKKYYLTIRATDDHCSAPAVTYGTVEITVLPNTTAIDEVEKKQELFQVTPNPSNGKIVIQSKSQRIKRLRLFNLNGQLISESELLLNHKVNYDINEPSGIYLLEVEDETGLKVLKKIIRY